MGIEHLGSCGNARDGRRESVARPGGAGRRAARGPDGRFARAGHASQACSWSEEGDAPNDAHRVNSEDFVGLHGSEGDDPHPFDDEPEPAPWRQSLGRNEPALGGVLRRQDASRGSLKAGVKSGYLAGEIEAFWRDATLGRSGGRSRLDDGALPFDDDAFEDQAVPRALTVLMRSPKSSKPSCLACGSPWVELGSGLCRHCKEAEGAAHDCAGQLARVSATAKPAFVPTLSERFALDDPIELLARVELGQVERGRFEERLLRSERDNAWDGRKSDRRRRLFRALALLCVLLGAAASLHGLGLSPMASSEGASHGAQ